MKLDKVIKDFTDFKIYGSQNIEINKLTYDSRVIKSGDIFFAQKGLKTDGHLFIKNAIEAGSKCIVLENNEYLSNETCDNSGLTKIEVEDSSKALALAANAYYDYPTKNMKMIGITGTNGKTTTSYLVKSILEEAGEKTGLIGTVNYLIGNNSFPAEKTTPESVTLFDFFNSMKKENVNSIIMEVSSHSLALNRVYGLKYDIAAFTNLTQDHLDFHINLNDYFKAKKILFDINLKKEGIAIFNSDDSYGEKISKNFEGKKISYGLLKGDVCGSIKNLSFNGIDLEIKYNNISQIIKSPLVGRFNAYNLLTAASIAFGLGIEWEVIIRGLEKISNVSGRFHKMQSKKGYFAIVDYSHTPDSLYNALTTIREVLKQQKNGKVITVFGCGGDRDKTKRPLMGKIAADLSDSVIITNDNPRSENPRSIIEGIIDGIDDMGTLEIIEDRKAAIEFALENAGSGDIILIAGKGHENYQEIKGLKHHFDDSEIIEQYFVREEK
jgi:UDP-N-acetylmuramoyl-L-alanyl-D-glutamate--2,6-diaminopimelate ligase